MLVHLQKNGGFACGSKMVNLGGYAAKFDEFQNAQHKCKKCENSKMYQFLAKKQNVANSQESDLMQQIDNMIFEPVAWSFEQDVAKFPKLARN